MDAGVLDLGSYEAQEDIHAVAGVLKQYLRDLPEPLLTHGMYDDWIQAARWRNNNFTSFFCVRSETDRYPVRCSSLFEKKTEVFENTKVENMKKYFYIWKRPLLDLKRLSTYCPYIFRKKLSMLKCTSPAKSNCIIESSAFCLKSKLRL